MSMPRFEPGSFLTARDCSTNWAINHWLNTVLVYLFIWRLWKEKRAGASFKILTLGKILSFSKILNINITYSSRGRLAQWKNLGLRNERTRVLLPMKDRNFLAWKFHGKIYARRAKLDGKKKTTRTSNGEKMQFHFCKKNSQFWTNSPQQLRRLDPQPGP
jgi:hypothetical protein